MKKCVKTKKSFNCGLEKLWCHYKYLNFSASLKSHFVTYTGYYYEHINFEQTFVFESFFNEPEKKLHFFGALLQQSYILTDKISNSFSNDTYLELIQEIQSSISYTNRSNNINPSLSLSPLVTFYRF